MNWIVRALAPMALLLTVHMANATTCGDLAVGKHRWSNIVTIDKEISLERLAGFSAAARMQADILYRTLQSKGVTSSDADGIARKKYEDTFGPAKANAEKAFQDLVSKYGSPVAAVVATCHYEGMDIFDYFRHLYDRTLRGDATS